MTHPIHRRVAITEPMLLARMREMETAAAVGGHRITWSEGHPLESPTLWEDRGPGEYVDATDGWCLQSDGNQHLRAVIYLDDGSTRWHPGDPATPCPPPLTPASG